MDIVFSKHAVEQMKTRGISMETVQYVLRDPEKVVDAGGKKVYQSVLGPGNERYLVRIFVDEDPAPLRVITVYKTSKIRKYHEG